jgi:hypothetical protein
VFLKKSLLKIQIEPMLPGYTQNSSDKNGSDFPTMGLYNTDKIE